MQTVRHEWTDPDAAKCRKPAETEALQVLEAMQHGLVVVTTPVGVEGIAAPEDFPGYVVETGGEDWLTLSEFHKRSCLVDSAGCGGIRQGHCGSLEGPIQMGGVACTLPFLASCRRRQSLDTLLEEPRWRRLAGMKHGVRHLLVWSGAAAACSSASWGTL